MGQWTYAEETLSHAIRVLGDTHAVPDDRVDAAWIVRCLVPRVLVSERLVADLVCALGRALDVPDAIPFVMKLLRHRHAAPARLARPLAHVADRAFRERFGEALYRLLLEMMEEEAWCGCIRDEWGAAALDWAMRLFPTSKLEATMLIGAWLQRRGEAPNFIREAIETRPEIVTARLLPPPMVWRIHRAAPTVRGWTRVAVIREHADVIVTPEAFGKQFDVAIQTLEQALGETSAERFPTIAVRLAEFLVGLRGSSP